MADAADRLPEVAERLRLLPPPAAGDGRWRRIHDVLRACVRRRAGRHTHPAAGCLDSQGVKTTEAALPETRGCDWHKRVKGRKRHVLTDTLGLLVAAAVTAANVQDNAGALLTVTAAAVGGRPHLLVALPVAPPEQRLRAAG